MITLIYKARTVAGVCRNIANYSKEIVYRHEDSLSSPVAGTILRWGSRWVGRAEQTLNSRESVMLTRNKKESRRALAGLCPKTWFELGDIKYPCIIRPRVHHAGNHLYVCENKYEARRAAHQCGYRWWYASEIVEKTHEYRVIVLQGRVIAMSERFPENPKDIAWNFAQGSSSKKIPRREWIVPICITAIRAVQRLGLDFGAVDLATTKDGRVVVFEANTAPGIQKPSALIKLAIAFEWVSKNPTPEPLTFREDTTWKELLHPALQKERKKKLR